MDIAAFIISLFSFIGGLLGYFCHDKKIKEQEVRLNAMQIKAFEKQEQSEFQAKMGCNFTYNGKSGGEMRFFNAGKANARNVRIKILDEDSVDGVFYRPWGPYDLITPQGYREEPIQLDCGHNPTLHLTITWDDDFGKDRVIEQNPQLS